MSDSGPDHSLGATTGATPTSAGSAASSRPAKAPVVRLQTWVTIVLLFTLLASCSAASRAGDAATSIGGISGSEQGASAQDVRDLCALIGAVAAAQGVDLDAIATADTDTSCAQAAREVVRP